MALYSLIACLALALLHLSYVGHRRRQERILVAEMVLELARAAGPRSELLDLDAQAVVLRVNAQLLRISSQRWVDIHQGFSRSQRRWHLRMLLAEATAQAHLLPATGELLRVEPQLGVPHEGRQVRRHRRLNGRSGRSQGQGPSVQQTPGRGEPGGSGRASVESVP